jgi:hypothetical protein
MRCGNAAATSSGSPDAKGKYYMENQTTSEDRRNAGRGAADHWLQKELATLGSMMVCNLTWVFTHFKPPALREGMNDSRKEGGIP